MHLAGNASAHANGWLILDRVPGQRDLSLSILVVETGTHWLEYRARGA